MKDWNKITKEDVIKAIEVFDNTNENYNKTKNTFLIYDGEKYPARLIRKIAYETHYGEILSSYDMNGLGGVSSVNFFTNLGFEVLYTGDVAL